VKLCLFKRFLLLRKKQKGHHYPCASQFQNNILSLDSYSHLCDCCRWSKIAQQLPGRTDNEIKNYWRTRIQKQARYMKYETQRTTGFVEFFKGLQMTRCVLKAQESSPSAMSLQDQEIPMPFDGGSHYSSFRIETTPETQITCQRGLNHLNQHEQNSDSEHNNGSSISNSESVNIQYMTQPLGWCTTNQFQALDTYDFGTCSYDGYNIDNSAYDMDSFNLGATMDAENLELPVITETNSLNMESECSTNDELWQFMNI